ncbi:hypothetical protein F4775DRAFT_394410 [Biscogniauxia sp. FL1348]|nr:hypothetical protein F4775DRAFT_394410 [Biscogniauxia sp. FL1348]
MRQLFGSAATPETRQDGLSTDDVGQLSIMLLGLCFRKPIEKHQSRQKLPDAGSNNSLEVAFHQLVALEWLKEVNDEAGEDYFKVKWCLTGCRKFSNKTLWRREMLDEVVAPLMRSYSYLEKRHDE